MGITEKHRNFFLSLRKDDHYDLDITVDMSTVVGFTSVIIAAGSELNLIMSNVLIDFTPHI